MDTIYYKYNNISEYGWTMSDEKKNKLLYNILLIFVLINWISMKTLKCIDIWIDNKYKII